MDVSTERPGPGPGPGPQQVLAKDRPVGGVRSQ